MQRKYFIFLIVASMLLFLANSGSHPVTGTAGYTGAPGDSVCSTCHTGTNSNLDGQVTIDGLPTEIVTGDTYTLSVTITNPNGNANEAGFQLLALTGSNTNAGSMTAIDVNTTEVKTVSGQKQYFGHSPAQTFPGSNTLSFDVDWTAPSTVGSNPIIKFYAVAVIANGNNQNSQDRVVTTNVFVPIVSGVDPLQINISNIISASCADASDGSATVNITGGMTPYTILWSSGETDDIATQIPGGPFSVTVTDANNNSVTASNIMPAPNEIVLFCTTAPTCVDANSGSAFVSVSGGTPQYTYEWDNGETTAEIENLSGGQYDVTVTDSNNCTASTSCFVPTVSPFTVVPTINNVTCFGLNNGAISLSLVGAHNPTQIHWNTGATTASITNLSPADYSVTIIDNAGCEVYADYTITAPAALKVSSSNVQNATCNDTNDGAIALTIIGGSKPYNYDWSNGSNGQGSSVQLQNVKVGTYTITITDLYDCIATAEFVVTGPAPIQFDTIIKHNVQCFGGSNGAIIYVPDSLEDVGYHWSTGSIDSLIQNLSVGKYFVTLTDSTNYCTYLDSFNISQPAKLKLTATSTDSTCINNPVARINLSGSGGVSPYIFNWSDGFVGASRMGVAPGSYTISIVDRNACHADTTVRISAFPDHTPTIQLVASPTCIGSSDGALRVQTPVPTTRILWSNGATTANISALNPGTFSVTITDNKGCDFFTSYDLTTSNAVTLTIDSIAHVKCFGDSTGFVAIDSISNFTLHWSNGNTGYSADNLVAGTYTVEGVDAIGCKTQTLEVEISQNEALSFANVSLDSILCQNDTTGLFTFDINGGVNPYTVFWNDVALDTNSASLPEGQHNFRILDHLGCSTTYTYQVYRAAAIDIDSFTQKSITCFGEVDGSIMVHGQGGWESLTYAWSNGATTNGIDGLSDGNYGLTVSDNAGCVVSTSFDIVEPDSISVTESITHESVAGLHDGKAELGIRGGVPPYDVIWSNGLTGIAIDSLAPGFINYTIVDQNNCTTSGMVLINGGACELTVSYSTKDALCFNSNDGQIDLEVAGNFEEYEVTIYNNVGIVNTPLDSLYPGIYTLFVKDSTNCLSIITDVNIGYISPKIIIDSLKISNPTSNSSKDGSIAVDISGGVPPFQITWFKNGIFSGTGESINDIGIGLYGLHIVDDAGCRFENNSIFIVSTVSADDEALSRKLTLYPNPSSGRLNISFDGDLSANKYDIYNHLGNKIHSGTITAAKQLDLQVLQIPAGMYIFQTMINGKTVQKPFIYLNNK